MTRPLQTALVLLIAGLLLALAFTPRPRNRR